MLTANTVVNATLPLTANDTIVFVVDNILQSESTGDFIEFDSPSREFVGNTRIAYDHYNEAIYSYERLSAEGPNTQGVTYTHLNNAETITNEAINTARTRTFTAAQLENAEVADSRELIGVRVTITRSETEVVEGFIMPICEYCDTLGATHHIFERTTYEWKQACRECYKRVMFN